MIVVSDTGPINYLILADAVQVLSALYGRVAIPQAVYYELRQPGAPEPVRQWIDDLPDWVEIHAADISLGPAHLDAGEREAIALAMTLRADKILVDERRGRKAAQECGLTVTGTLGILDAAARRGLIDLAQVVERLRQTNFRADPKLIRSLLDQNPASNEK